MKLLNAVFSFLFLFIACSTFLPMERSYTHDECFFCIWIPDAISVQVIGDWNRWGGLTSSGNILDPSIGYMNKDENGFWTLQQDLSPGRYRYIYLVDGFLWKIDPGNPETSTFTDKTVSLLVVEG